LPDYVWMWSRNHTKALHLFKASFWKFERPYSIKIQIFFQILALRLCLRFKKQIMCMYFIYFWSYAIFLIGKYSFQDYTYMIFYFHTIFIRVLPVFLECGSLPKIRHIVCQLSGVSTRFQLYHPCLHMLQQNMSVNGENFVVNRHKICVNN